MWYVRRNWCWSIKKGFRLGGNFWKLGCLEKYLDDLDVCIDDCGSIGKVVYGGVVFILGQKEHVL